MGIKKRFSISNTSSLIVFVFSLVMIFGTLIKSKYDIANSLAIILDDGKEISSYFFTWLIIIGFFTPILIYFIKLFFSMSSVEHNDEQYKLILGKLSTPFLITEHFIRLLIYTSFLLLAGNYINWAVDILNIVLNNHIIGYGLLDLKFHGYLIPVKGFPSLLPILSFNVLFFFLLIIWDTIVYIGNRLAFNENFTLHLCWDRFLKHHLIGLILWSFLVFILLTNLGFTFLSSCYVPIAVFLGVAIVLYIQSLIKSLRGLRKDFDFVYKEIVETK